jgi:rhamnosyltransferase
MTSANILNLTAYQRVGPFRDELFIDHVDHEYGLRLNAAGLKVIQVNTVNLNHIPGAKTNADLKILSIPYVSHNLIRSYYFVRNGFWVCHAYKKKYPVFGFYFFKLLVRHIVKAVLFQENRKARLQMMLRGYQDYKQRMEGEFHERK